MALLDGDGIMLLWDRSGACYEQIIQPSRVRRCRTTARGPGTGDRSIGSRTDGDGTAQPNRVNGVDHGNFCSYSRWSCSSLCPLDSAVAVTCGLHQWNKRIWRSIIRNALWQNTAHTITMMLALFYPRHEACASGACCFGTDSARLVAQPCRHLTSPTD
jgi:hypothetical protein